MRVLIRDCKHILARASACAAVPTTTVARHKNHRRNAAVIYSHCVYLAVCLCLGVSDKRVPTLSTQGRVRPHRDADSGIDLVALILFLSLSVVASNCTKHTDTTSAPAVIYLSLSLIRADTNVLHLGNNRLDMKSISQKHTHKESEPSRLLLSGLRTARLIVRTRYACNIIWYKNVVPLPPPNMLRTFIAFVCQGGLKRGTHTQTRKHCRTLRLVPKDSRQCCHPKTTRIQHTHTHTHQTVNGTRLVRPTLYISQTLTQRALETRVRAHACDKPSRA